MSRLPRDYPGRRSRERISDGQVFLTHPADWVIELDECATDPLEAARQSRGYLESLAGRTGRNHE